MAEQLFRDHAADLHRFLVRRVNDPRDADDLLQEVFLRAVRTPPAQAGPAVPGYSRVRRFRARRPSRIRTGSIHRPAAPIARFPP